MSSKAQRVIARAAELRARVTPRELPDQPAREQTLRVRLAMPRSLIYRSTDRDYVLGSFVEMSRFERLHFDTDDRLAYTFQWNLEYAARRLAERAGVAVGDHARSPRIQLGPSTDLIFAYGLFPRGQTTVPVIFEQTFAPGLPSEPFDWSERVRKAAGSSVDQAAAVVTASEHSLRSFQQIFPEHAAKARCIPYFLPHLLSATAGARRGDGRLRLVFVGKEARRKGLDSLVAAWRILPEAVRARIDVHVVSRFIDGRVSLPESWRHDEFVPSVVEALRAADALVFPTKAEAYGLVLSEGLACGCAVVTTHAPIQRSIVGEDAGLFVDPHVPEQLARAITELACDAGRLASMRVSARRRFEEVLDPRRVAGAYARLMYEVAGKVYPDQARASEAPRP